MVQRPREKVDLGEGIHLLCSCLSACHDVSAYAEEQRRKPPPNQEPPDDHNEGDPDDSFGKAGGASPTSPGSSTWVQTGSSKWVRNQSGPAGPRKRLINGLISLAGLVALLAPVDFCEPLRGQLVYANFDPTCGFPGEGPPKGSKKERSRDLQRGSKAWENAQHLEEGDFQWRLITHTITDRSAHQSYLREVSLFLSWIERTKPPFANNDDVDFALARYESMQCYLEDRHSSAGDHLMNGLAYLYPEMSFPLGWQSSKGWGRVTVENVGQPIGEESAACMEHRLRQQPCQDAQVSADLMTTCVDTGCREGELLKSRKADYTIGKNEVAIHLGVGNRGESTKTGRFQGVRVDGPYVQDILLRRLQHLGPADLVFPISATKYQVWWKWAAQQVGGPAAESTPHAARHTMASRDVATGYRTIEQIARRGRWQSEKSVRRYARTADWIRACEAQPAEIVEEGRKLLASRPPRPLKPKE